MTDNPAQNSAPTVPNIATPSPPGFTQPTQPPATTESPKPKRRPDKRIVLTILGILFLIGGVSVGVSLVGQRQEIRKKAAVEGSIPIEGEICPSGTEIYMLTSTRYYSDSSMHPSQQGVYVNQSGPNSSQPRGAVKWAADKNDLPADLQEQAVACQCGDNGTCEPAAGFAVTDTSVAGAEYLGQIVDCVSSSNSEAANSAHPQGWPSHTVTFYLVLSDKWKTDGPFAENSLDHYIIYPDATEESWSQDDGNGIASSYGPFSICSAEASPPPSSAVITCQDALADNFNDNQLDITKWATSGNITETDGAIQVTYNDPETESPELRTQKFISGDLDVRIDFISLSEGSVALMIEDAGGNNHAYIKVYQDEQGRLLFETDLFKNEDWLGETVKEASTELKPAKLRIVREGSVIKTYYQLESDSDFILLNNVADGFNSDVEVVVEFESNESSPNLASKIDNFSLSCPVRPMVTGQCREIKFFDTSWNRLTGDDLAVLKPGETLRISVLGTTNEGRFDKARFTINDQLRPEVTSKRPETDEFYDDFIIPEGTVNLKIIAELHHELTNTWF